MNVHLEKNKLEEGNSDFPKTLIEAFERTVSRFANKGIAHVVSRDGNEIFQSYKELMMQARKFARVLRRKGLKPQDPVILMVSKSHNFLTALWGCLLAGIVPAPLPSIRNLNSESIQAKRLINASEVLHAPIICDSRNQSAYPLVRELCEEKVISILTAEEIIAEGEIRNYGDEDVYTAEPDNLAIIQFSSGSTGNPKGVQLTHHNIISSIKGKLNREQGNKTECLLYWLPFFHDFGLFGCHIYALVAGMKQVRIDPMHYIRNPLIWIRKIHEHQANITASTNTGMELLVKTLLGLKKKKLDIDLSCLRVLTVGAEMISILTCKEFTRFLAPYNLRSDIILKGYGLAEATLGVTGQPLYEKPVTKVVDREMLISHGIVKYRKPGEDGAIEFADVGYPLKGCEVRIVDGNGNELPSERVGIIEVRGENVMRGYYNNPEANKEVFNGDWLCTGDLGFMDDKGRFCVTGREKEIIIKNGLNYFPYDIEQVAWKVSGNKLRQIIACGYYDSTDSKEKVLLFFVLNKLKLQEAAPILIEINKQINELVGFQVDHFISIKNNQIPRTSSAKIMRTKFVNDFIEGVFKEKLEELERVMSQYQNKLIDPSSVDHQQIIREIWMDALEISDSDMAGISSNEGFFTLGGDSMRAMKALAHLEEYYKIKLEMDFMYKCPTISSQIKYFSERNHSIESPQNELELLIQSIVAKSLNIDEDNLGVTSDFIAKASNMSKILMISEEIKKVFNMENLPNEFLKCNTIRQMAEYLQNRFFDQPKMDKRDRWSFPLMNFQETLYFHYKSFLRNEPTGLSCYIVYRIPIYGEFNLDIYNKAFNIIILRHSMLRSVINEDKDMPCFKTLNKVQEFRASFEDISHLDVEKQNRFLSKEDIKHHDHRFILTQYPLFYSKVYKVDDKKHEVVIHIDHQLVDGYSFVQLVKELLDCYDQLCLGQPVALPETGAMEFKDYVLIEKLRGKTAEYKEVMDFALDVFRDIPPKATLPFKRNPAMIEKVIFDTYHSTFDPEVMQTVMEVSNNYPEVNLNSLLLACYFKLMNIWTNQDDLIINMPIYNREHHFPAARKVVGSFLDIFPVRLQTSFDESIMDIAKKAEKFVRGLLKYPVSSIELTRLIAERDRMTQGSLSSIIFSNSINMISGKLLDKLKTIRLGSPKVHTGAPGTFIDLVLYTLEGNWYFDWNYVRDLFDRQFIETLARQYEALVIYLAEAYKADRLFESFTGEGIMPKPHQELLRKINQTEKEYPATTLYEWITKQVEKTPDNLAATFEDKSITYRELHQQSNQVAHLLSKVGIKPNEFVALILNRSIDMIIGQLGVLKAGGAYIPIDPTYPYERIKYMLKDCGAKIILTQACHADLSNTPDIENVNDCLILDEEEPQLKESGFKILNKKHISDQPTSNLLSISDPEDLMYMIYTSGSTGKPKGVMVRHRNFCNFIYYVQREFKIGFKERFALITSYSFDMTLTSNWVPFVCGGSLHILSEEKTQNIEQLINFLSEKQITFLNITPSHFSLIANAMNYYETNVKLKDNMKIVLGAEIINTSDLNMWLEHYPMHRFINEYGPTETTVASTFFPIPINSENKCELHKVPIGKPIYNTQIYILNDEMKPCMVGVAGHMYIAGDGVSKGYWNKPEKTGAAFIPNPFKNNPDEKMYKTGDMARFLEDGNIEFLGRKDHQVNLRGYRIELGEIENTLAGYEAISESVVTLRKNKDGQLSLVAFYTLSPEKELSVVALRDYLSQKLPDYMVPVYFHYLEKMPLTASGKVNRNTLPDITVEARPELKNQYVAPSTKLEKKIGEIWGNILGTHGLGIHDNFWEVGGDSLRAMRLIQAMRKEGFADFALRDAFDYPTVTAMVEHIDEIAISEDANRNVVKLKSSPKPLIQLFCLPYAAGNAGMYSGLSGLLPDNFEVISAQLPGHGDDGKPLHSIEEVTALYVDYLKKSNDIPLFILGYSYGGYIAYNLIKTLEEQGQTVTGLIQVGVTPPNVKDKLMKLIELSMEETVEFSLQMNIVDKQYLNTMSREEIERYIELLRIDTRAMINYQFDEKKISTPVIFLSGRNEEDSIIRDKKEIWMDYCKNCSFNDLPGGHLLIKTHTRELAHHIGQFINEVLSKLKTVDQNSSALMCN